MRIPSAITVALGSMTAALLLAAAVIGAGLWRSGWTPFLPTPGSPTKPAPVASDEQAQRYSGVAQIQAGSSCTGWLLDTGVATAPAYVVTTGRCTQARNLPGTAVGLDLPASGQAEFGVGIGVSPYVAPAERVVYATMNGTDIAVIRMGVSLGELQNRGIRAYRPTEPPPSRRMATMVGVPVRGLPASLVQLRAGQCLTGPRADLLEFRWFFDDALVVDCPGVIGGSSGSPLFDRAGRVVGMTTTSTAGALPGGACYLDNPCEVGEGGVAPVSERSYAVSVAALHTCFSGGRLTLDQGCPLPRPGVDAQAGVTVLGSDGDQVSVAASAPAETVVATAVVPLTSVDACDDAVYDTPGIRLGPEPVLVPAAVPAEEGHYLLCLKGSTVRVALQRDLTPPVRTPEISTLPVGGGYRVRPLFSPPELSDYLVKLGPAATTDCGDNAGYRPFRRAPLAAAPRDLPATFCAIGLDLAGNPGPPVSQTLG